MATPKRSGSTPKKSTAKSAAKDTVKSNVKNTSKAGSKAAVKTKAKSPPIKATTPKKAVKPTKAAPKAAPKKAATSKTAAKIATKSTAKAAPKAASKKTAPKSPTPKNVKVQSLPHMDGKTLGEIIEKLDEMRRESQIIINNHMHSDLQPREDATDVGDDLDQASNERDREFNLIMHQRHLRRLNQVEEAFDRIKDGSYGLCEGTDEPINPKRLLIMPLARYSLEYQEQQEKTLGRSYNTGSVFDSDESFSTDD